MWDVEIIFFFIIIIIVSCKFCRGPGTRAQRRGPALPTKKRCLLLLLVCCCRVYIVLRAPGEYATRGTRGERARASAGPLPGPPRGGDTPGPLLNSSRDTRRNALSQRAEQRLSEMPRSRDVRTRSKVLPRTRPAFNCKDTTGIGRLQYLFVAVCKKALTACNVITSGIRLAECHRVCVCGQKNAGEFSKKSVCRFFFCFFFYLLGTVRRGVCSCWMDDDIHTYIYIPVRRDYSVRRDAGAFWGFSDDPVTGFLVSLFFP